MVKFFVDPFAVSGDRSAIPDAAQGDGSVSYSIGYGVKYDANRVTDPTALTIERVKMNELFYDITTNIQQYQIHGTPEFITSADNGGTAFSYSKDARVRYNNGTTTDVYVSLADSNTALPTVTANWSKVNPSGISNGNYGFITVSSGGLVWSLTSPITFAQGGLGLAQTVVTGDVPYASAANTMARAAIGASGTVFKSNGTIPAFALPAGARRISSNVISAGTTQIIVNNFNADCDYKFVFRGLFGTSTAGVIASLSTDNGATFITTSNAYGFAVETGSSALSTAASAGALNTVFPLQGSFGTVAGNVTNYILDLIAPVDVRYNTPFFCQSYSSNGTNTFCSFSTGARSIAESNNAIKFSCTAGTFGGGILEVWEIRAS